MVELTKDFIAGGTCLLHRLDVRFKMASLVLFSISTIYANFPGLFLLLINLGVLFFLAKISIRGFLGELRYFFIFIFLIFGARTLSTPGDHWFHIGFSPFMLPISKQGVYAGILVCFRLFLVFTLGYLFISFTRPSQVRVAVAWFLKPVPLIPEKQVATMLSLLMRFLPLIIQQAHETADAQRARCVENRKNPFYRVVRLIIPMLRRTFLKAEDLVMAMEARGYSEKRTLPRLHSVKEDWFFLGFVITLSLIMIQI